MNALGPRLEAALALAGRAVTLADVGTDHGFLPIAAVARGICRNAVAIDNKEGPLRAAGRNVIAAGLADRVRLVLADGLPAGTGADVVCVLGMGGIAIAAILSAADLSAVDRLVLGPHAEPAVVRAWLEANGFRIEDEAFVPERGKHYQVLSAVKGVMRLTDTAREFGPVILAKRSPAFVAYLSSKIAELEAAVPKTADPAVRARLEARVATLKELIR